MVFLKLFGDWSASQHLSPSCCSRFVASSWPSSWLWFSSGLVPTLAPEPRGARELVRFCDESANNAVWAVLWRCWLASCCSLASSCLLLSTSEQARKLSQQEATNKRASDKQASNKKSKHNKKQPT